MSNIIKEDNDNYSNLNNFTFLDNLTNESYSYYPLDNTFCSFKSFNNILYLIYSDLYKSIISYDLTNFTIINKIQSGHINYITNLRYYPDIINNKDLVISISADDNNLKVWDVRNWECLINFKNINDIGYLFSACLLSDNNQNYIITSNVNKKIFEPIKVFDLKGNKIKEIDNSKYKVVFIDSFYDKKLCKNFLITGNEGYAISYDFTENKIYHKYNDKDKELHLSIIINNNNEIVEMIESSLNGNVRIWNFHSGELLNKIKVDNDEIYGICLLNGKYLFTACYKRIKIIDIVKGIIIKIILCHKKRILTLKTIIHPYFGECLLSQSHDDIIKLWKI